MRLKRGDTVMLRSPSGGGYGPAHERPLEMVIEDVREGFVSAEAARECYGVVIGHDGRLDVDATRCRREKLSGDGVG